MARKPPKPIDRPSQPRAKAKRARDGFPFPPPFPSTPAEKTLTLSDLSKWPTIEEWSASPEQWRATQQKISEELHSGSDRAAAIMGALYVHDVLNGLVITHLTRRDESTLLSLTARDGTLYSMGSAAMLAFAMGLIEEKTKMRLDTIRRIRNAFAHALRPISFDTRSIADARRSLDYKPSGPTADAMRIGLERMTRAERARHEFLSILFVESEAMAWKAAKRADAVYRSTRRRLKKVALARMQS